MWTGTGGGGEEERRGRSTGSGWGRGCGRGKGLGSVGRELGLGFEVDVVGHKIAWPWGQMCAGKNDKSSVRMSACLWGRE